MCTLHQIAAHGLTGELAESARLKPAERDRNGVLTTEAEVNRDDEFILKQVNQSLGDVLITVIGMEHSAVL